MQARSLIIRRLCVFGLAFIVKWGSWTNHNVQMTTITQSKSVSFSFLIRPTYPVLLLIFYLQQEIKLEWPKQDRGVLSALLIDIDRLLEN